MNLTCPYCSGIMTIEEEVADGQNVLCPYCGKKSSFRHYVEQKASFLTRVLATAFFAGLAVFSFKLACLLFCDEEELYACEGSRPDDNGGYMAIPSVIFAVLALMPWLPPANRNRHYRELQKQKEDLEESPAIKTSHL